MTTILVVEDEIAVATVVQKSLQKMGYQVPSIASTGEDALRLAGEVKPNLVLMDIGLKGRMDGIKAAEAIRDHHELPVVYLTGYADEERLSRARVTDAYGYILKPFNNNELRSTIEMALYKHQMAQQLKERERWFSTTLRSIGDAVIAVDKEERITFLNPRAEALTGWSAKDAEGRPLQEVYSVVEEEGRAPVESPAARVLRDTPRPPVDLLLLGRDGNEVSVEDSASVIRDEKGNVLGVVVSFRDVTERKRLEKRLAISERMASLGTLAAGIAHEINNPLAYVLTNMEFCRKALDRVAAAPQDVGRYLDEVRAALQEAVEGADRMRRIVADVKTFSRPEGEERTGLDVRAVLDASLKMVSHLIPPNAQVLRVFGDVPSLSGNESRMGQLFVNLLTNAAQSLPLEGDQTITVTTRPGPGPSAIVEVHDTGTGIAPEVLRRMFDPFFSTKPVGVGTGLGLAICHRIVTDQGGEIRVESQVGRGTTFTVILPVHSSARDSQPPRRVKRRILVVDTDPGVTALLQELLDSALEIVTAKSAQEVVARAAHEQFDAILCDMAMGDMTGMELYAALSAKSPELAGRLVFIRGADSPQVQSFLQRIPNRWLSRPLEPDHVRKVLGPLLQ